MSGAGPALLLAAGLATRLGALRESWAKACLPVGGSTALRFLLPRVAAAGYAPIWVNLHHHAEQVRAEACAAAPGAELRFLAEPELLGTGGTLLAVAREGGVLPRLTANLKIFTDFPLARLRDAAAGTLVLHPASPLQEFGGIAYDTDGRVNGLAPRGSASAQAAVFTGLAVPHPSWLEALAAARERRPREPLCSLRDGMTPALAAGVEHRALLHGGAWCEISTPERVAEAAALQARLAADRR